MNIKYLLLFTGKNENDDKHIHRILHLNVSIVIIIMSSLLTLAVSFK